MTISKTIFYASALVSPLINAVTSSNHHKEKYYKSNVPKTAPHDPWSQGNSFGISQTSIKSGKISTKDGGKLPVRCGNPLFVENSEVELVQDYLDKQFVKDLRSVTKKAVAYDSDAVPELKVKISTLKKLVRSKVIKLSEPVKALFKAYISESENKPAKSGRVHVVVFQKQAAGVNAQNPNPHYHKKTVDMMGQKIPVFGQVVYAASISTEEKQSTRVYTKGSVHKTKDLGPAKELSLKGGASIQTPVNTLCVFSGRSVHSGPSEAPVYRRFLVAMNDIFSQMIDFSKGVY